MERAKFKGDQGVLVSIIAGVCSTISEDRSNLAGAILFVRDLLDPAKIDEKLNYMHLNPVRAGLVEHPTEWRWGSARWYIEGRTVGISIQWVD